MNRKLNKKGFTLIEVVLVLAIGGLIFLLAFIAYQQVARNRRDTARRNDAGRVLAQIQTAYGDGFTIDSDLKLTGSASPVNTGTGTSFLKTQFNGQLKGPEGLYTWDYTGTTTPASVAKDTIYVGRGVVCDATSAFTTTGASTDSYAVIVGLAGTGSAICRSDN